MHVINLQSHANEKSEVHWIKSKLEISIFPNLKMDHLTGRGPYMYHTHYIYLCIHCHTFTNSLWLIGSYNFVQFTWSFWEMNWHLDNCNSQDYTIIKYQNSNYILLFLSPNSMLYFTVTCARTTDHVTRYLWRHNTQQIACLWHHSTQKTTGQNTALQSSVQTNVGYHGSPGKTSHTQGLDSSMWWNL